MEESNKWLRERMRGHRGLAAEGSFRSLAAPGKAVSRQVDFRLRYEAALEALMSNREVYGYGKKSTGYGGYVNGATRQRVRALARAHARDAARDNGRFI